MSYSDDNYRNHYTNESLFPQTQSTTSREIQNSVLIVGQGGKILFVSDVEHAWLNFHDVLRVVAMFMSYTERIHCRTLF